ncbi:peptide/nickel transport system permease protein [Bosea sp. AK1]|uniref:ABC transporter permease n=1 Tax=Bosea sp. AK1 TaxID=2587160 RepID=UPI0011542679|nr:ABC transporter permease [Bosea sp. AK1]TQI73747.1 peptide/nickel transport system permease protein [Bosea sp. AK1]
MAGYVLKRLLSIALTMAVMSVLIFWITQVMPGNVAYMILGDFASPQDVATLEAKLGLNDPAYIQYLRWASGLLQGDLGRSLVMDRPIAPVLWDAVGKSAILAGISIGLVALLGISLGVYAGVRHGRISDHIVSVATYINIAIPEFLWAIVIVMLFAGYLNWFPATGYSDLSSGFASWARHLILPVFTLVTGLIAHISRLTRSSMIDTMQTQYVRAARARGLPEKLVIRRHALPNALLPTITILAIDVGIMMGGIVVVETIFSYPGLGRLLMFAIQNMDVPLLQACMMVITFVYAAANLIADLLYAFLNPKVRYGRSSSE